MNSTDSAATKRPYGLKRLARALRRKRRVASDEEHFQRLGLLEADLRRQLDLQHGGK